MKWISMGDALSLEGYDITITPNRDGTYFLSSPGPTHIFITLEDAKLEGERFAREQAQRQ